MKLFLLILLFPMFLLGQTSVIDISKLIEEKKYSEAQQRAVSVLDKNPNNLEVIELLGDSYGYMENWDLALENYKKLVDKNPNNANYQYKQGGVLAMKALTVSKINALGIINEAKAAFVKAAELDPNHIETRWALVELYMQLPGIIGGSISKSLQYANELEAISQVDGFLAKGIVYQYDDKPNLAELNYKQAILVGGSVTCYQSLIDFYLAQNQKGKAIYTLEEAYKTHQTSDFKLQLEQLKNSK